MSFNEDMQTILDYAHFWNWSPDWNIVRDIYTKIPDSYSVLTPFAYSYLEELVRSRTTDYGMANPTDDKGRIKGRRIGKSVFALAIYQNKDDVEYCNLLEKIQDKYYVSSSEYDRGDNRNSTMHGYMHPSYWSRDSFEQLIHDIAILSPYAGF